MGQGYFEKTKGTPINLFAGGGIIQSLSRVWLLTTPWAAARQASLSSTISLSLLTFTSFESVMPSNHLILCCPLLLLPSVFSRIKIFSNESALHIRWPKYGSVSISPSNEYSGLISFRMDWFDLLAVQGALKSLFQHHNSSTLSLLYSPTLTSIHDYWKNHSFYCTELLLAKWCLCFLICYLGFLQQTYLVLLLQFLLVFVMTEKLNPIYTMPL